MTNNSTRFHRRSIRIKGYDYTLPGAYFVTLVTKDRKSVFGRIESCQIYLSRLGEVAQEFWKNIPDHFQNVKVEPFVIMPNHIHGIITIFESRGTTCRAPSIEKFGKPVSGSLPTIIRSYKSAVSRQAKLEFGIENLWQRDYFERVIRNQSELEKISSYIQANPINWYNDLEFA